MWKFNWQHHYLSPTGPSILQITGWRHDSHCLFKSEGIRLASQTHQAGVLDLHCAGPCASTGVVLVAPVHRSWGPIHETTPWWQPLIPDPAGAYARLKLSQSELRKQLEWKANVARVASNLPVESSLDLWITISLHSTFNSARMGISVEQIVF